MLQRISKLLQVLWEYVGRFATFVLGVVCAVVAGTIAVLSVLDIVFGGWGVGIGILFLISCLLVVIFMDKETAARFEKRMNEAWYGETKPENKK